ncbi:hypothetical protein Bca4012_031104 [Brassica carinata]
MGQEEEGEGEGSIPIAVSGLIDSYCCFWVDRFLAVMSNDIAIACAGHFARLHVKARRTHASIADLENEKQSHEKKLEQFLRKASEERAAWWSREHEKALNSYVPFTCVDDTVNQCGKWTHELLLHNSPPCSRTVKTKTFELFTEEDDEDFITPPPVNDSKTKTLVKPTNTQMESSLISSVSSFEASYLQLQSAHSPFVEETVKAADRALVSNLQKLSDLKQVQENQSKLRALGTVSNRLQAEMDGKDSRVLSLRKTLSEAQKSNSKLSKRLSENSSDVVLSVRVYESMLRDVMKAASYVHPEVDYAEKGHYRHVSSDPMELLERDKDCAFSRFCDDKYHELIYPNMESSIFSNMDQREAVLSSWRSLSTFYESFLAMASSSGVDFSIVFMEDVLRRKQDKKLTVNLTRGKVTKPLLKFHQVKLFQWTSQQDPSKQTQCFTYRELATATNNFRLESMTGHGGFGSVFKGKLEFPPGQFKNVAVKMLDTTGHQGDKEFLVEVLMLSLLRHEHLVTLFGYCAEGEESSFKLIAKRGKLDNLNPRNA